MIKQDEGSVSGPAAAGVAVRAVRRGLAMLPRGRARLARAMGVLLRKPFIDTVEPANARVRMVIDPSDPFQLEIWAGAYQPHVVSFVTNAVRAGDRVLCAGLHVGYVAALARRSAGSTGLVLSAEPDVNARTLAERNLALSADGGVAPIQVLAGGLSDTDADLLLHQSAVLGHSSFAAEHQPDRDVTAQSRRGDDWLSSLGVTELDVLVLDVEGWETHVLSGLVETIDRSPRLRAMVEVSDWALRCAGSSADELHAFWRNRGFDVHWVDRYGPNEQCGAWGEPVRQISEARSGDVVCVRPGLHR